MSCEVVIAGERLVLRADRTVYYPRCSSLILADPHFGKPDAFRAAGIPVPGDTGESLARLSTAIDFTGASRLIVLGDFWHAREGRTAQVVEELNRWRAERPQLTVDLVRGNHDRAGRPPKEWADDWRTEIFESPFVYSHFPEPAASGFVLAGHLHPGIVLEGRGRERLRLPCFAFSGEVGVLPAFGDMTGTGRLPPELQQKVFVIAGDEVVPMPAMR